MGLAWKSIRSGCPGVGVVIFWEEFGNVCCTIGKITCKATITIICELEFLYLLLIFLGKEANELQTFLS